MLIPITFNPNSSSSAPKETPKLPPALAKIANDEVILIELQGVLEVEVAQPMDKNGKFVGKLSISEDGSGKPTLLIGHHLLEGKITTMNKPLAILTRSRGGDVNEPEPTTASSTYNPTKGRGKDSNDLDAMDCNDDGGDRKESSAIAAPARSSQWEAVGIVKRKIVFATRPMPIVGRPS